MSTSLSLPQACPPQRAIISHALWASFTPKAQLKINRLKAMMERCEALPRRGKRKGYAAIASEAGISAETGRPFISAERLRRLHAAYEFMGEIALLDRRLLLREGGQASTLHEATVQHWCYLAEKCLHQERKQGTISFAWAWKELMRQLMHGDEIPGLGAHGAAGTWRDLYVRLNSGRRMPAACPWNLKKTPPGHSENNFRERQCSALETLAAQRGLKELQLALPQCRMDVSNLRPLEVIQFDDVELNMRAWCRNPFTGDPESVKINAVLFMDVRTRRILWAQFYPAFTRPDGTRQGIERIHVQHGLAWVFATYGYPLGYDCVLRCENATAAVVKQFEDDLLRLSNGRIKVCRTKVYHGVVLPDGFKQKVGASWQKPHMEAMNRKLAIALGHVPGQQGASYQVKPLEAPERLAQAERVFKKVGHLATDEELNVLVPLASVDQVKGHFLQALYDMETDPLHSLQGFQEVMMWRHGEPDGPNWKPMNHPLMQKMLARHGHDYVNDFLREDGNSMIAKETIQQAWGRLYRVDEFAKFSPEMLAFLWLQSAPGKWTAFNEITVTASRDRELVFSGARHTAEYGQKVTLKFDADNPGQGAVLIGEQGVPLGWMKCTEAGDWGDHASRVGVMKQKEAAMDAIKIPVSRRHITTARLDVDEARIDEATGMMTLIRERAIKQVTNDGTAEAVLKAFTTPAPEEMARPGAVPVAADLASAEREQEHLAALAESVGPGSAFTWWKE